MQQRQSSSSVIMVYPRDFSFNPQTAMDNEFQNKLEASLEVISEEFENSVRILRDQGISVLVFDKKEIPQLMEIKTPDAIFPNNWLGTNIHGEIIVFPMANENRRAETLALPFIQDILVKERFVINGKYEFSVSNIIDGEIEALEGTGSLILDHSNKIAYAALSRRTNLKKVQQFCRVFGYESITFHTKSSKGKEFYHTNIIMSIGERFAVVCEEAIESKEAKEKVIEALSKNREVITISLAQTEEGFAGNILELRNRDEESFIVMSETARSSFTQDQLNKLEKYGRLLSLPIPNIEKIGGGSARCMLCENFLPIKLQK